MKCPLLNKRFYHLAILFLFAFLMITGIYAGEASVACQFQTLWPQLTRPWYFNTPYGVAVDGSGNVYIADTSNKRIQKFDLNGNLLAKWGSYGSDNGQFDFRRQGFFVGSGVVEAGCRTVIGQRLKQSGMHWTVEGANNIIALRCCFLSNRWEDLWETRSCA